MQRPKENSKPRAPSKRRDGAKRQEGAVSQRQERRSEGGQIEGQAVVGQSSTLGGLLRSYRMRAGLTQQELAGRAGMSVRALRDLEHGRVRDPRSRSVGRLATALRLADVDYASLMATAGVAAPAVAAGRLRIDVLGPLSVRRGDAVVEVRQAKLRGLLGLLGLQPGQMVSRQELVDALWGEQPPDTCLDLIHTYVARLRDLLEPGRPRRTCGMVVVLGAGGYRLDVDADELDVLAFADLEARARAAWRVGDLDAAQALFGQAVELWRGPVLADLGSRLRQHPAAVRLAQRRLSVAVAHADLAIDRGRWQAAAGPLVGLCAEEPFHEGLHARLMLALAGGGRQAEALRLFGDLRARLADELGVEPGDELTQAQLRILRGQLSGPSGAGPAGDHHRGGPTITAHPPARAAVIAQLPPDVAGFTGRTVELGQLNRLEQPDADPTAVPITVITGTAGVGKTALAVHWAHRVRDRFPGGQLYVNLGGYQSTPPLRPLEALTGFLRALDVPTDQIPIDADEVAGLYRSLLADRRMLVLLDNARSPDQVRPLLPGGPGCRVVVTGRDRLSGLVARDGADLLDLDVLSPAEAHLLLGRVLGRRVEAESAAAAELAQVCAFLPLALRIAAANLTDRARTIAGYVAELRASNRLAALAVDGDEQAAVRAAFDQSYAELAPEARRLFRLLGLVPGPEVTSEAAAALVGTSPESAAQLLDRLAGAHLLGQHAPGRFGFHDLLRLYARGRTEAEDSEPERQAALGRLLDWYLHTTAATTQLLYPNVVRLPLPPASSQLPVPAFSDRAQALAWLDAERSDLVAAVQHAAEHGPRPSAWLLADALHGYLWQGMYVVDWSAVAEAALAAAQAEGAARAQSSAQLSLADLNLCLSRYGQAIEHYSRALALNQQTGWLEAQAATVSKLGVAYARSGRLAEAADHHRQALTLNQRIGRVGGQATNLGNLGVVYLEQGRLQVAFDHHAQALALFGKLGYRDSQGTALAWLGEIDHALGRFDGAVDHANAALAIQREVGDRGGEADTLRTLAGIHRDTGRHDQAFELATTAAALAGDTGERRLQADALNTLASVHLHRGSLPQARDSYGQALELARATQSRYPEVVTLVGLATTDQRAGRHDQALVVANQALTLARQAGFRLLEGQALTTLASIQLAQDQRHRAIQLASEALAIQRDTGHRLGQAHTLLVLGHALHPEAADAALLHWQQALALFSEIGTPQADHAHALVRSCAAAADHR